MTHALANTSHVSAKTDILRDRATMLARVRAFFYERSVLEVDCPILSQSASVDAHIDLIPATYAQNQRCYLHSSPEYGMKRLLADGIEDIFQLSHVFRDNESSKKHNPEFMMIEWYRLQLNFEQLIQETIDLVGLFVGDHLPRKVITYRQAFKEYAGIDYVQMSERELFDFIQEKGILAYPGVLQEGKDALLNLILGTVIEPHLGRDEICALAFYPSTQAALAKTCVIDGEQVARRFEVYYKGLELANGYHELADPVEQRRRLHEENAKRIALGKNELPIDEDFLQALEKGLPECCGVAVGFDRLMMLRHNKDDIAGVIPIPW